MLFLGTYDFVIDERNRLTLPTKLVNFFSNRLAIISKGFDSCLEIWTQEEFKKRSNEILSFSSNKIATRILSRQIFANCYILQIDKVNRILIPTNLKNQAQLTKEVVIIGVGNKLEIWDKKTYLAFLKKTDPEIEKIAEEINNEHK